MKKTRKRLIKKLTRNGKDRESKEESMSSLEELGRNIEESEDL